MNEENFERLVHDTGIPLDPEEIATDENLSLAALDNQLTAARGEADPWTMTADKLAEKLPGMGIASLQLPPGLAERYDLNKHREEDEEILRAEQTAFKEATMNQQITQTHRADEDGNPAGGSTSGRGISISWQNGPLQKSEGGTRNEPNGAFVEGVISAALGRLEFYQDSKFACDENAVAIHHLQRALEALEARTAARVERGVEGTHIA